MVKHTGMSSNGPQLTYSTSCPAGVFDTSARLDAHAAVIRNQTWINGPAWRTWDSDHAAAPEEYPVVRLLPSDDPTQSK